MQARNYSATETLRDGREVEIRALKPEDRAGLLAAVGRTSDQSLYRRFFGFKRGFTDHEVDFYVNVDFVGHVALVAVLQEDGRPVIIGGSRYIVVQPGQGEVAFAVDDAHQGQGIGPQCRAQGAGRRRSAGEHRDAEGFRDKRLRDRDPAGAGRHPCRASTVVT